MTTKKTDPPNVDTSKLDIVVYESNGEYYRYPEATRWDVCEGVLSLYIGDTMVSAHAPRFWSAVTFHKSGVTKIRH